MNFFWPMFGVGIPRCGKFSSGVRSVIHIEKTSKPAEQNARRGDDQNNERELEHRGCFRQTVVREDQKPQRNYEKYHHECYSRENEECSRQVLQLRIGLATDVRNM